MEVEFASWNTLKIYWGCSSVTLGVCIHMQDVLSPGRSSFALQRLKTSRGNKLLRGDAVRSPLAVTWNPGCSGRCDVSSQHEARLRLVIPLSQRSLHLLYQRATSCCHVQISFTEITSQNGAEELQKSSVFSITNISMELRVVMCSTRSEAISGQPEHTQCIQMWVW